MTQNKHQDSFLQKYWRPLIALTYAIIILFDFIIAPVLWTSSQIYLGAITAELSQWIPLTLQSNGLFHISIGGILGISAYTRGQEKIERLKNGVTESNV